MKLTEKLSVFGARLGTSVKSLAKVALLGRRPGVKPSPMAADGKPLIILGNGPVAQGSDRLQGRAAVQGYDDGSEFRGQRRGVSDAAA